MNQEGDFALGPLTVCPLSHEVVAPSHVETLEPRVMAVLAALARRRGAVVTRDALVEQCWSGRAVSEDAIQRCIARLRRLGEAYGGFAIDTIRGVGYRLREDGDVGESLPSLAVLAFDNLSGDPDLDYFSDGVSEEILHVVARAAPLKVIGRISSFRFRGADKSIANVASQLNVTHLLDGSVRRSGARMRISVRLVETGTERTVWSDRFERGVADSFAVQDEIARAVATALGATLRTAAPSGSVDPFAYDLIQRGRELGAAFGKPGAMRRAIALIEEALTRAPQLPGAWALLAQLQVQYRALDASEHDVEPLGRAIVNAVEHAMALDPEDGGALACLAFVEPPAGAFARQEAILLRAMAAANAAGVHAPYSTFCASVGRNREALSLIETARQCDPLHSGIANWRAILLWQNGAKSREVTKDLVEADGLGGALLGHAALLAACDGDWAFVDRLLAGLPAPTDPGLQVACTTIAMLRDPHGGRRLLDMARADLATTGTVSLGTLCLLAHLGLVDEAYELAECATFEGLTRTGSRLQLADVGLHFLFSPASRAMWQDRRFVGLCAKLGLVDYWKSTGRWPDCIDEIAARYDFIAACGN